VRSDERMRNHFFSYAKIVDAQVRMDGRMRIISSQLQKRRCIS